MPDPVEAKQTKLAKPQLSLIPVTALLQEARAMQNGKDKYGRASWRKPGTVSAYEMADAMMRHVLAWLDGEECAPDSGVHHLAHVRAGAGIVLDAMEAGTLNDDRIKPCSSSTSRPMTFSTPQPSTASPSLGTEPSRSPDFIGGQAWQRRSSD